MADSDPFAAIEAQVIQANAAIKELIGILQLSPDSRPIFAESILEDFGHVLTKITEASDSHRQRIAIRDEREIELEQGEKNLEEKEKFLAQETAERVVRDRRLEEKALELKRWEERLVERELDVTRREKLLNDKMRAVDGREMTIDRLAEDTRRELRRLSEATNALNERKETVVAAEGRQAADEQALERWQDFLRQKHDSVVALNETLNELRTVARSEHIKAVEQLNKDMRIAHETFKSAEKIKATVVDMYQKARSMVEDIQRTEIAVARNYEKMLKGIQEGKQDISRLKVHATLFKQTISSEDRAITSLMDKVGRLSTSLEKVGNGLDEQEARFDDTLRKIGQISDASGKLDELNTKLAAFTFAASDAHGARHDVGSSPEKGPPAKRQRHSGRARSVGPTEMLSSSLGRPEPLPANLLDPFITRSDQGLSSSDPMAPSQTVQTSSTLNVQSSSPGTIVPSNQTVGPSSANSATDPKGLADASDFVKSIWSQIDFPRGWLMQDSKALLERFIKNEKKDLHWKPDACMNRGAKWVNEGDKNICLIREFTKKKATFPDGIEKCCEECKKKGGPCVNVLWAHESEEAEGGKKWLLVKRK